MNHKKLSEIINDSEQNGSNTVNVIEASLNKYANLLSSRENKEEFLREMKSRITSFRSSLNSLQNTLSSMKTNKEDMTFDEWYRAATNFGAKIPQDIAKAAWENAEDPTEYANYGME